MKRIVLLFVIMLYMPWTFAQLAAPALSSPNNNTSGTYTKVMFSWSKVTEATSYTLQVDTSASFDSPLLCEVIKTATSSTSQSWTLYNLRYGTTYHWRVRANGSSDTSAWSAVRTLTTTNAVSLSSPNNNITGAWTKQTFWWYNSQGSKGYILELDTAADFSSPLLRTIIATRDSTSTSNEFGCTVYSLRYGTTYRWRVRAYNSADTSGWSAVRTLTTTDAVSLSSPNNNITGAWTKQTFWWYNSQGSKGYILELDTAADFSSPLLRTIIATRDSTSTSNEFGCTVYSLRYGTTYRWRVRAYNSADTSGWSAVRTLTTTDAVSLSSPNNNITGAWTKQTFWWYNSQGSKGYILELDTAADFSSPLLRTIIATRDSTSTSNEFGCTVYSLRYGTTYRWRVRAYNSADTSGWSAVRTLTTTDAVSLSSPNNNITGAWTKQTFWWYNSQGSKGYILELDTAADFSSPLLRTIITTKDSTSTSNEFGRTVYSLRYGTTYHWRVRAYNSADTSGWSAVRTLTTTDEVYLNSPTNNSTGRAVSGLSLYWNNSQGSKGYILELDVSSDFSSSSLNRFNLTRDSTNTANTFYYNVNNLYYGTTYYWRMRAYNSADTSGWSSVWAFTTVYNTTDVPVLTTPANDSVGVAFDNIILVWQAMANMQGYHYEVSTHSTFDTLVASGNTSLTFTALPNATPSTTYYWRVRGYNAQGNTPYSATWHFTTADVWLTAPVHVTPANGASMPVNVALAWHPVFGAVTYDLQLSLDSNFNGSVSSFNTADTHYLVNGLPMSMTVYWRVRSNNGNDVSAWSSPWYFTTNGCTTVTDTISHEMCEGGSYEFFGTPYTYSGTYSHTSTNSNGCDSVVVLALTVWPRGLDGTVTDTACDSYLWNNLTFTQSGNFPFYTTTIHGCDSMITLHLTLYNSVTDNIYDTVSGSYEWNGEVYNVSGEYTQSFNTMHGCDSTVTLHLVVTAGIGNVDGNNIIVYVRDGHIVVDGLRDEMIEIYDTMGRPVCNRDLPSGVYLVKIDSCLPRKVVVVR